MHVVVASPMAHMAASRQERNNPTHNTITVALQVDVEWSFGATHLQPILHQELLHRVVVSRLELALRSRFLKQVGMSGRPAISRSVLRPRWGDCRYAAQVVKDLFRMPQPRLEGPG